MLQELFRTIKLVILHFNIYIYYWYSKVLCIRYYVFSTVACKQEKATFLIYFYNHRRHVSENLKTTTFTDGSFTTLNLQIVGCRWQGISDDLFTMGMGSLCSRFYGRQKLSPAAGWTWPMLIKTLGVNYSAKTQWKFMR